MINKFKAATVIPPEIWLNFETELSKAPQYLSDTDLDRNEIFTTCLIRVQDCCADWRHMG